MSTQEPQGPSDLPEEAMPPMQETPLSTEDEEAEAEAMAELRRQDVAEEFRPGADAPPPVTRYVTPMAIPPRQYHIPDARPFGGRAPEAPPQSGFSRDFPGAPVPTAPAPTTQG